VQPEGPWYREGRTLPWVVQADGEWETVGWSVVEVWYLGLDHVGNDCGPWLT